MGRTAVFLAFASLLVAPAAARGGTELAPAGPWRASNEAGLCRVERPFVTEGQPHLLVLEQSGPGSRFGMAVAGPSLEGLDPSQPLILGFTEGDPWFQRQVRIDPNRQYGKVAVVRSLSIYPRSGEPVGRIDPDLFTAMDRVTISQGDTRLIFATGSLGEAASALNACTGKMLSEWGLDPEVQYALKSGARPEREAKLAKQLRKAYPARAYGLLQNGPLEVVALVGADGAATECKVMVASRFDQLDAVACKAITEAQYAPARDATGNPVASFWQTRITFALSEYDPVRNDP